ncbi:hypothetical protein ACH82I_05210 [Brevibacterium sp. GP-SGM9]|uniref:hypothetical protein n=1 Tax=Brevibacterium sp. GP-SGM9 TaxID=3376990 RepID=UPI0039A620C0
MDDEKYELDRRTYHSAKVSGVLAAAITAFLAFSVFELFGFEIVETATWMFALSLMAGSGTFVAVYIVTRSRQRNLRSAV